MLGLATMAAVGFFQVTWLSRTYRLKHQENTQEVSLALIAVARNMATFMGTTFPNENPVVRVSPTYFIVNINDVIEPGVLDHFLNTEFSHRDIKFNYEYAIYDCATDQMVYAGTSADHPDHGEDFTRSELEDFPQLPEFTYYFGINFPDLPKETTRDLRFWFYSAALMGLAMIFFAYALFIIFRQKRLSELQRDFVNAMTHEFKTPLSTLRIASDVLKDPSVLEQPKRLHQYGVIIGEQVRQLQSHVDRILEASSMDRRRMNLNKEVIPLEEAVKEAAAQYEQRTVQAGGQLNLNLACQGLMIKADRTHFYGVVHNLLDNAVKFAAAQPIINLNCKQLNNSIQLSVCDNGPGIPLRERRKVFRKHYRVPEGRVQTHRGFGIGLFYVAKVVKAHGWKISIDQGQLGGARFNLQIPIHKV
jgi:two-component system phosphate regulon sensor histidine kinase PhoR